MSKGWGTSKLGVALGILGVALKVGEKGVALKVGEKSASQLPPRRGCLGPNFKFLFYIALYTEELSDYENQVGGMKRSKAANLIKLHSENAQYCNFRIEISQMDG